MNDNWIAQAVRTHVLDGPSGVSWLDRISSVVNAKPSVDWRLPWLRPNGKPAQEQAWTLTKFSIGRGAASRR